MNGKHFEIGTIQAFLDGETTPEMSLRLTDHIASCDACAKLLATAEEESSLVFSALERELNTLVPTQRLWSRINESITVEQNNTSVWDKVLAYIRSSLANPSIAVAAGIILMVGMFAILWMPRNSGPQADDRAYTPPAPPKVAETISPTSVEQGPQVVADNTPVSGKYVTASNKSANEIKRMMTAEYKQRIDVPTPQHASDSYLPGEESYVKTIADLNEDIDSQKDAVLTPSTRISYERDMAVVDDSIKRMREVVKKNPRNQAARQVLYTSYQDKIDLLNSVAQREELIASVR